MNFSQQLSLIKTLVPEGEVDTRIDCPFCNHTNTLIIRRIDSDLFWNCFSASCSAKGKHEGEMSMQQVYETVVMKEKEKVKEKDFVIPKSFVSIFSTDKCTDYLKKNHCSNTDTAVLVEDCASACSVSESEPHTGVALMGTSLPDSYIPVLKKKFKKVIVALDRDATTKAFDISNQLRYYMDTEVKILEDDLKYFDKTQIESLFNE